MCVSLVISWSTTFTVYFNCFYVFWGYKLLAGFKQRKAYGTSACNPVKSFWCLRHVSTWRFTRFQCLDALRLSGAALAQLPSNGTGMGLRIQIGSETVTRLHHGKWQQGLSYRKQGKSMLGSIVICVFVSVVGAIIRAVSSKTCFPLLSLSVVAPKSKRTVNRKA
jgi:hypothetical protein